MRRRSLARQLSYGALVALLAIVAVPIVFLSGRDGIESVRAGDASAAIEQGLVALVAAFVPVIALATYAHWLEVSARPRRPQEPHVSTRVEDVLLGAATTVVVIAAWPVCTFCYRRSTQALAAGVEELAFAVGWGLLAVAYVAFALLCVTRFVQWLRS